MFQLVDPAFVERSRGQPWTLLEAHFTSVDHPPTGAPARHIPGAIQVHPSYVEMGHYPFYERPADGNLLPLAALRRAIRRLGITANTRVVVYGRAPDGTMAAARLVWALLVAGVREVRMLDGGLDAWVAAGKPTTAHIETATDVARGRALLDACGDSWLPRPDLLATTADVCAGDAKLVDVRGSREWDGTVTDHYPFFCGGGHIPGAIHQGDWDNLIDPATTMLGPRIAAVAHRWRRQGILDADVEAGRTPLIFYCGTGWRSSVAFLVAQLLGVRARNYDGGYYGWSRRTA